MSIYATGWSMKLEMCPPPNRPDGYSVLSIGPGEDDNPYFAEVYVQFVPGHIGHAEEYPDGDPYADFLPPPLTGELDYSKNRAAVILLAGQDEKGGDGFKGQQYHRPLLVLSGDEYENAKFPDLLGRIAEAAQERLEADGTLHKHKWVVPDPEWKGGPARSAEG